MKPLDDILAAARRDPKRVVLPEGEDPRITEGAVRAQKGGLAHPILIGRGSAVAERLSALGANPADFEIIDPASDQRTERYATVYHELRKHKGMDEESAVAAMKQPLPLAAMMVREGDADGALGGAVATTADTVRAALQIIGRAPGVSVVSSFFLMMLCEHHHTKKGALFFADCGLIVEPTVEELAQIAISTADSFQGLIGNPPRVALLSFSTAGSARHERVTRINKATELVHARRPDLIAEGELQFDAVFEPAVAAAKAPSSKLEGTANVLIFPSLEAANIGYKIAQRIGGAKAIGPVLQGLAKPANDLSRGCSADDVYHMIATTGVQACVEAGSQPIH